MKNLENLKNQLIYYENLYNKYMNYYVNLSHNEKMNSDVFYSINITLKRIKNIHININQLNQKL